MKLAGPLKKTGVLERIGGAKGLGFELKYFKKKEDLDTFFAQQGSDAPPSSIYEAHPVLKLGFDNGKTHWHVLNMKVPFNANAHDNGPPTAGITLQLFPAPEGGLVWINQTAFAYGMHEENGMETEVAFYTRSLGAQVKVIGSASTVPAALAALKAQSLAVTEVELKDEAGDVSGVYYRGAEVGAAAQAVGKAIGASEVEALKKKGWLHLIVVAGRPATK